MKTKNRLGGKMGYVIFPEEFSLEIDTTLDFIILENYAKLSKT
jgi:CMP-N-acetylneuraminic acid synthetase